MKTSLRVLTCALLCAAICLSQPVLKNPCTTSRGANCTPQIDVKGAWVPQGQSGPAGPAGPMGPAGPAGEDGAPGIPGYSPNTITSGGSVVWKTGLEFTVSATTYIISGATYTSPQATLTLDAADATHPRIDAIAVDSSSAAVIVKGVAAANPAKPDIAPASQLLLTFVLVPANSSTPSDVTDVLIYDENAGPATEWSCAKSGTPINLASTTNPYSGTKDIQATAAANGNYFGCAAASPFVPSAYNYVVFYVRSKATWGAKRAIQVQLRLSTAAVGSIVSLNESAFGFNSSSTTAYQQIAIPVSLFGKVASADGLRFTVSGTTGSMGFYFDLVKLQAGVTPSVTPTSLSPATAWVSTAAYTVNESATYGNALWQALASNTNSAPTCSNTNWKVLTPLVCNTETANRVFAGPTTGAAAAPTFRALVSGDVPDLSSVYMPVAGTGTKRAIAFSFDGGGAALATGKTAYLRVPFACTITDWSISSTTAETVTVKFWKVATGTALPTVSESISTSGVSLSSGTHVRSTTLTDFTTTAISANDIIAANITAITASQWALAELGCQQ